MESSMRMREDDEVNMSEITVDYQGGSSSSSALLEDCYPAFPTQWTNEKHCLYLKSMEASFVKQLHSSMPQPHNIFDSSLYQIKTCPDVLGSGKSGRVSASRWIRHYMRHDKNLVLQANVSQEMEVNHDQEFESKFRPLIVLNTNSKQSRTTQSVWCRQTAVGNNTEMMGQNFDGNDQVIGSSLRNAKRKQTATTSGEDNDQVVPVGRPKEMRMR